MLSCDSFRFAKLYKLRICHGDFMAALLFFRSVSNPARLHADFSVSHIISLRNRISDESSKIIIVYKIRFRHTNMSNHLSGTFKKAGRSG